MIGNSFILLSRSLLESQVFADERMLKIWIWCLCKANHKKAFVPLRTGKGVQTIEVKRGQFIFGRNKAAEELFIKASTVYSNMQKLEALEMVKIDANNQYSIVTICNYDTYQDASKYSATGNEQPKNNQRTAVKQPSNTNKNDNNVNNINYQEVFDVFRKEYPGTKRGNETEFENFCKKHSDWQSVVPLLLPSLKNLFKHREQLKAASKFVPEWPNFQTFINQRRWETEVAVVETPPPPEDKQVTAFATLEDRYAYWGQKIPEHNPSMP